MSRILSTRGGCIPAFLWAITQTPPPRQTTPSWVDTSIGRHPPPPSTMGYSQQSDRTHPTGMYSCLQQWFHPTKSCSIYNGGSSIFQLGGGGIPERGERGSANLLFGKVFAENYMKMEEIGLLIPSALLESPLICAVRLEFTEVVSLINESIKQTTWLEVRARTKIVPIHYLHWSEIRLCNHLHGQVEIYSK